jgi:hypothetical protein
MTASPPPLDVVVGAGLSGQGAHGVGPTLGGARLFRRGDRGGPRRGAGTPPLGGGEGRKPAISLGELCRVPLFMVPKGTPVLERASPGFAAPIPHPAG